MILARLLVVSSVILRPFLPTFRTFLGDIYYFHVAIRMTACFFFGIRPPGELDNKRSSTRRGEFDSSTPEAIGVLLGQIFLARRFRVVLLSKPRPIKKWE